MVGIFSDLQPHESATTVKSAIPEVQIYFERLPEDRREALGALRSRIRHVWPDAVEDHSYGMPTYHLKGQPLFALASQKHFMVLYVLPYDLLDAFKNDLKVHDCGKSCIRFKRLDPVLFDLFDRIIKYTGSQLHLSRVTARPNGQRKSMARV